MNLPNGISLLRILLIPLLIFLLLSDMPRGNYYAAGIFAIVAASDALDGYLARKLKKISKLGKLLDPLADKLLVISALFCLLELDAISIFPLLIIVARDLTVDGLRAVAGAGGKIIAADMPGKVKTAVLDIAVIMLILNISGGNYVLWAGVVLSVLSGANYFAGNWKLLSGRIRG